MPTTRNPRTPHHAPLAVGAALVAITALTGCARQTPGALTADQVLADGAVSDAEYRSAIDSVAACIQAAGWQASPPQPAADQVRLTIGVSPKDTADPTEEGAQIDAALALAGAWDEGVATMRQALRLNPGHPGYMHQLLALDAILAGDDAAALADASLIQAADAYWGPFYRSLALAGLGYLDQARSEFAAAVAAKPALAEDPWSVVGSYANFTDEQRDVILDRVALIRGQAPPALRGED